MSLQIVLLPGPVSGSGRNERVHDDVRHRLERAGHAVRRVQGETAAATVALLREALAADRDDGIDADDAVDAVVVLGGDGMVNIAAQVLAGTGVPLGIIPLGTGNDTARSLGIPLKDVAAATDVILGGRTRRIDLARASGRYFATVMAAGFDAAVNERADQMAWPKGQLKYSLAILAVLARFRPIPYTLELVGEDDTVTRQVEGMLVSIGNTDSMGGGLRVTHGADVADGLLDVVLFRAVPRIELIKNYPKLFTGGHTSHPAYERHRVRRVTVAAPGVVAYADGERFGALPMTVEVVPAALSVLVP